MSATLSVDLADREHGAAALVRAASPNGGGGTWLVVDGGRASEGRAGPEELRIADDGERATVSLKVEVGELELEARRLVGVGIEEGSAFAEATGTALEAFAVRVEGEWSLGDRRFEGLGRLVRISGEPDWGKVELVRSLTATLDDGSLLVVAAARPVGASGHGGEVVDSVVVDADGAATRFEETLLSTEYGPDGRHRRAGVELWAPGDAAPMRGAGTRIGGGADVAFLRFTVDGAAGTARYELMRRA